MNRKLQFLALVLAAALLCACGSDAPEERASGAVSGGTALSDEIRLPQIDEDYFELLCGNCDVEIVRSFSTTNGTWFHLISAQPLTEEQIAVSTSAEVAFTFALLDNNTLAGDKPSISDAAFLLYQGHTAEEVVQFITDPLSLPREKMEQMMRQLEKLSALPESELPRLYLYEFVFMPSIEKPFQMTDLTITIGNISKTYTFDGISNTDEYAYYGRVPQTDEEIKIRFFAFFFSCAPIHCNTDGEFALHEIMFTTLDEVTLTGIRFYNHPETRMLDAEIAVTDETGNTVSTQWDGIKPFPIAEGAQVSMYITVKDAATANKAWQNCVRYLLLDYRCEDGEVYTESVSFFFWQRLSNPYEYYLALEGYDIFPVVLKTRIY